MRSLPFYSRWWFAPILIAIAGILGAFWFLIESIFDRAGELDFWFYLREYSGIGAATGFAAWYFARLVARKRVSVYGLACLTAPAYLFVVSLALNKNPLVAALATVVFGFISLSFMAKRSVSNSRRARAKWYRDEGSGTQMATHD